MNLHRAKINFLSTSALERCLRLRRSVPALAVIAVLVAGCAGHEEFDLAANIKDAYVDAQQAVDAGNYRKAIAIFEGLQARFPFSDFSTQIQLELAYAYYKDGRVEQAIDAADTFLRENPTHQRVDYAIWARDSI